MAKGSSINDITRFWGKIKTNFPSPLCHISLEISELPSKMTLHAYDPDDDYYCQSQWQSISLHDRSTVYRSNASVPQPALQSSCSRLQSSHPSNDHHRQHTPATGQRMTFCESQRVLHDVTTLSPPPPLFVTYRHTSLKVKVKGNGRILL